MLKFPLPLDLPRALGTVDQSIEKEVGETFRTYRKIASCRSSQQEKLYAKHKLELGSLAAGRIPG